MKKYPTGGLAKSVSGVSLDPPGCQKRVQTIVRQNFGFLENFPECPTSIKIVSGRAFGPSQETSLILFENGLDTLEMFNQKQNVAGNLFDTF